MFVGSTHANAVLHKVKVEDVEGYGIWLRGSAKCWLTACYVQRVLLDGYYIEPLVPCRLHGCHAEDGGNNAAVFDFPDTVLAELEDEELDEPDNEARDKAVELLAREPHFAQVSGPASLPKLPLLT